MHKDQRSKDSYSMSLQPIEDDFERLLLGLLDSLVLVFADDCKACNVLLATTYEAKNEPYRVVLQDMSIPEHQHPSPSNS